MVYKHTYSNYFEKNNIKTVYNISKAGIASPTSSTIGASSGKDFPTNAPLVRKDIRSIEEWKDKKKLVELVQEAEKIIDKLNPLFIAS